MSGIRSLARKSRPKPMKGYWIKGLAREDGEKLPLLSESELVEMKIGAAVSFDVDDILFVSVPPTTTQSARDLLQSALNARTQREVMIITHNIEILKLEQMSSKDLNKLMKRARQDGERPSRIVVPG